MWYQTWLIIILKIWYNSNLCHFNNKSWYMCPYFPQMKKKSYFIFPAIILLPTWPMYTVWAGGIYLKCLSLGYRFKVSYLLQRWTRGEQIRELCKFYVWWLVNLKDKASLFACGGKGHFIPTECIVARRKDVQCRAYCWYRNAEHLPEKYLMFRICGRNITLTQRVHKGSIKIVQTQNSYSFHMKVCLGMSECIRAYIWKQ
jgi:hypothetical protein